MSKQYNGYYDCPWYMSTKYITTTFTISKQILNSLKIMCALLQQRRDIVTEKRKNKVEGSPAWVQKQHLLSSANAFI